MSYTLKRKFSGPYGAGQPLKRAYRTKSTAAKVSTLATRVNRILKSQEKKFFDTYSNPTAFATAGVVNTLNSIPQGDDAITRDGRRVMNLGIHFHFRMSLAIAPPLVDGILATPTSARVILFYDKDANGAAPSVTDILDVTTGVDRAMGFRNMNNYSRFVILLDSQDGSGMREISTNSSSLQNFEFSKYIKCPKETVYADSTTAVPVEGSFGIMLVGATGYKYSYATRVVFTDS